MSAALSTPDTRLLLGMTPPPPDREEREREGAGTLRTLLDLLTTDKFDGSDSSTRAPEPSSASGGGEDGDAVGGGGGGSKWRILKERFGCCGTATWRYGTPPEEEEENGGVAVELQEDRATEAVAEMEVERGMERETEGRRSGGMNLAAALAAERQYRAAENTVATPTRVSLMRLLEETTTVEEREKGGGGGGGGGGAEEVVVDGGNDSVCCVCMGRKKGAALIPCGHTYCRVCSREVWVNRGACPLCNRPILEILDIF